MKGLFTHPVINHLPPYTSDELLADIGVDGILNKYFEEAARFLTTDPEAIAERNAVTRTLGDNKTVLRALSDLLNAVTSLESLSKNPEGEAFQVLNSFSVFLGLYSAVNATVETLRQHGGESEQLAAFSLELEAFAERSFNEDFLRDWDEFACGVDNIKCLVFRLGLNEDVELDTVVLEKISDRRVQKKLLPVGNSGKKDRDGADTSNLFVKLKQPDFTEYYSTFNQSMDVVFSTGQRAQIFSSLYARLLETQADEAKSYLRFAASRMLSDLHIIYNDLKFLIGAISYIEDIRTRSLPFCFASVSREGQAFEADGMYHPQLAENLEKSGITFNSASSPCEGEIILIGGANKGGKTTFLRTCAAVQILFQMGLPVPAERALLTPARGIVSIFSKEERTHLEYGKLGLEIHEICGAVDKMDSGGMFFFNEPISSTSPTEGYLLSRDLLCIMRAKCIRGVWVTHYLQLFDDIAGMNELFGGGENSGGIQAMHVKKENRWSNDFTIYGGLPEGDVGAAELFWR